MAGESAAPATTMGPTEHRGGVGRALHRLRNALRRTASSRTHHPGRGAITPAGTDSHAATHHQEPATTTTSTAATAAASNVPADAAAVMVEVAPLVADDDGAGDTAEVALPMLLSRGGISSERSKMLCEKYGIAYTPSDDQAPPNKVRRVEKPVRIRIHWTCHECHAHFPRKKTCAGCGHHRCGDCDRSPPRKAKNVPDRAGQEKDQEQEAVAHASPTEPRSKGKEAATAVAAGEPPVEKHTGGEADDDHEEFDAAAAHRSATQLGPRSAEYLVLRRRPPPEELPEAPAVRRVYRKARQRVRYICEQCRTTLAEGQTCHNCGHRRCEHCIRDPPKKALKQRDPALLRSVSERLAAINVAAHPVAESSAAGASAAGASTAAAPSHATTAAPTAPDPGPSTSEASAAEPRAPDEASGPGG